jgi:hypothetical protein
MPSGAQTATFYQNHLEVRAPHPAIFIKIMLDLYQITLLFL